MWKKKDGLWLPNYGDGSKPAPPQEQKKDKSAPRPHWLTLAISGYSSVVSTIGLLLNLKKEVKESVPADDTLLGGDLLLAEHEWYGVYINNLSWQSIFPYYSTVIAINSEATLTSISRVGNQFRLGLRVYFRLENCSEPSVPLGKSFRFLISKVGAEEGYTIHTSNHVSALTGHTSVEFNKHTSILVPEEITRELVKHDSDKPLTKFDVTGSIVTRYLGLVPSSRLYTWIMPLTLSDSFRIQAAKLLTE